MPGRIKSIILDSNIVIGALRGNTQSIKTIKKALQKTKKQKKTKRIQPTRV